MGVAVALSLSGACGTLPGVKFDGDSYYLSGPPPDSLVTRLREWVGAVVCRLRHWPLRAPVRDLHPATLSNEQIDELEVDDGGR